MIFFKREGSTLNIKKTKNNHKKFELIIENINKKIHTQV